MLYQSKRNKIFVDVTKAPYFADNTGKTDCTKVLCQAIDDILIREIQGVQEIRTKLLEDPRDNFRLGFENRKMGGVPTVLFPEDPPAARILYFPEGVYLISDTLTYSFENLKNLLSDKPGSDLNRFIHFKGEGADKSIIKLQDNCHEFRFGEEKPMVAFVRSNTSNVAMMNTFEDIGLDCGEGNTGAVGIKFHSSNTGKIRNVNIVSSDSDHRGFAAILMDLGQENITENVRIDGFEYGIKITARGPGQAFENIQMDHILRTAVHVTGGTVGLRHMDIRTYGMALYSCFDGMVSLLDSKLTRIGDEQGNAVRSYAGMCYLRNVDVENFGVPVVNGYEDAILENGHIDEYNSEKDYTLYPVDKKAVRLPVEEQPTYEWNGDTSIVAEVDDFGAKGDGVTDATAAIQAAMNSGKEYIVFGEGRYLVSSEIHIPASVRAINFMYCDFAITPDFAEDKVAGMFVIDEASDKMLFMDDAFVFEKFYGYIRFIRHSAKRDLAISNIHVQTGAFYYNTVGGSRLFFDNTACTMGVFGGIGYGSVPCYHFKGQRVWARQFNPERSAENCLAEDKTDLWVFGFKTEGPDGKAYNIRGGSRAEIFSGNATIATDNGIPCIENENSTVFAYFRTDGCGPHHQFAVAVNEIQGNETRVFKATDMPKYSVEYYYIPGYYGVKQ